MENIIGIIVAVLSLILSLVINLVAIGVFIGKLEGFKILVDFRFNEQDKKLEKHNNFINRLYEVEKQIGIEDEKIDVANNRIKNLEVVQNNCKNKDCH